MTAITEQTDFMALFCFTGNSDIKLKLSVENGANLLMSRRVGITNHVERSHCIKLQFPSHWPIYLLLEFSLIFPSTNLKYKGK